MHKIYLDNNATTPVAKETLEAMLPYFCEIYGNPSSSHKMGMQAERAIKVARRVLAEILRVKEYEIIFTSGGTESANLALQGALRAIKKNKNPHIISSRVEHHAVLATLDHLQKQGVEIDFISPDPYGQASADEVCKYIKSNTALVALMHVNNELGTVNPIEKIASEVKKKNKDILVFSDGAQAFGKCTIALDNIDMYSLSGHKFHAPKGIGALYVKEKTHLLPLILGGGQELTLRSGTENVPNIVGLAHAAQLAYANLANHQQHMAQLKAAFLQGLQTIPNISINSPPVGLENTLNISLHGIPSEVMMHALEEKNIFVSAGSACTGAKGKESSVLQALGLSTKRTRCALRFSFSRYNTLEEIEKTLSVMQEIVINLRKIIK